MLLELENIVKQYANHRALDGVSLSIPENSIYGLLGPNGAGKTTLIRIINRIIALDSGELRLRGKAMTAKDVERIGYLPEERGLYKKMKVGEQAIFLARLKGMSKSDATKALKYWFEKFEIEAWWDKKLEELSKGMAQKVQFIITVLHQPELLIFDEPFSGFDPVNVELLKNEILELRKNGATIIFSTHNMDSVEELCENISLVNKSKIVLQGSVFDIRSSYTKQIFLLKSTQPIADTNFDLVEQNKNSAGIYETKIKKPNEISNNDFLRQLMSQTEILAFDEQLPSMNDIFIETVK